MQTDNIIDNGSVLIVTIPDSKTHTERRFTVIGETGIPNLNLLDIYRKYAKLRPENAVSKHFFLSYRNEKCTKQVIGINTFSKIPSIIAKYLNLSKPDTYTGHTFRRTSASLLVDSGGDILKLKQHGGWKSTTVAEGYVVNSLNTKMDCASRILSGHDYYGTNSDNCNQPSTSTTKENENRLNIASTSNNNVQESVYVNQSESKLFGSKFNINNPSNCTFNITITKESS